LSTPGHDFNFVFVTDLCYWIRCDNCLGLQYLSLKGKNRIISLKQRSYW